MSAGSSPRNLGAFDLQDPPDLDGIRACVHCGISSIVEPEMASQLLERKVQRIADTGARVVVTGNPGCALQIAKGCRERGLPVELLHPVELLGRALSL